ncbi:MAG TPA: aromatic amino acid lyase, partial [Blastocatellia bacterium]|nr:aromatic amino acid lyase [Blastocatellia bacterium]
MTSEPIIEIEGSSLTLEQTSRVADGAKVALADVARGRIEHAREFVERLLARGDVVYGVNTGFGALSDVTIPHDKLRELQVNLVRSHSCGVGEPLSERVV